jgi:hypothetical protein
MFFGYVGYSQAAYPFVYVAVIRLATNIIVSSMLILGGSATVTDLTGMSTIAVSRFSPCTSAVTQAGLTGMLPYPTGCFYLCCCGRYAINSAL